MTVVAAAAAHDLVVRAEIEVPRVARVVGVERTRPVDAMAPSDVERTVPTVASGGQKESVAVRAGEASSFHSVLCGPCGCGVVHQFFPLFFCRGTPAIVGGGGIVAGLKDDPAVGIAAVAI